MYLSMWMIREGIKGYHTEAHISYGEMCIRNASLLYQGNHIVKYTVYIFPSENFIATLRGKIVCVNRNDYIVVDCDNLEEIFTQVNNIIDYYMEWDLHVQELCRHGCGLQELVEIAAGIFRKMVCVTRDMMTFEAIAGQAYFTGDPAYVSGLAVGGSMPPEYLSAYIRDLPGLVNRRQPFLYEEQFSHDWVLMQCFFMNRQNTGGILLFLGKEQLSKGAEQLFSVLYRQIQEWREGHADLYEAPFHIQVMESFLLPGSGLPREEIDLFFRRIAWKEEDEKYLCVTEKLDDSSIRYFRLTHALTGFYPACIFMRYESALILLLNPGLLPPGMNLEKFSRLFSETAVTVGISYPFQELEMMETGRKQARIALEYGMREHTLRMEAVCPDRDVLKGFPERKYVNYCVEYALEYAKNILKEYMELDMLGCGLRRLRLSDETRNTSYIETLYVYLREERSLVKAAKQLNIHVNTLKYRLKKIRELEELDLEDADARERLMLALALR